MKGKAVIPLVLGLCIGLFAVKFLMDTLKKAKASDAARQTIAVVRAKQDIGAFEQITAEMVELLETNENNLAPRNERLSTLEEVVGRVTAKGIPQNVPVLNSMLAPAGTEPGTKGRIPPGFRAVSVKIDEVTGVAYQVRPGDWVDVIVVMDIESGDRRRSKETIAEVILQHVQVAAIGQSTGSASPEEGGAKMKPAKSATLLVKEEDAPTLHMAATRGKITLAMRGADDQSTGPATFVSSSQVFRGERDSQSAAPSIPPTTKLPQLALARPAEKQPVYEAPPHGVVVYRRSRVPNQAESVQRIIFENAKSSKIIDVSDAPTGHTSANVRMGRLQSARPATGGEEQTSGAEHAAEPAGDGAEDYEAGDGE